MLTTRQVANALELSPRQTRRLRRRFERDGAAGPAHRSRGPPSRWRLEPTTREAITELMTTRYVGFNDRHLTEKLQQQHGLLRLYAQLCAGETMEAAFRALRDVFTTHGLPIALYTDRAGWAFYTPDAGRRPIWVGRVRSTLPPAARRRR